MCGFCGFIEPSPPLNRTEVLSAMNNAIKHRGPNDSGQFCDFEQGVFLGHQRLSILDISHNGHQPMSSPGNSSVLVFNGEIYNHKILRSELEAEYRSLDWTSSSDSETLLTALSRWGVQKTLNKIRGMYAFSFWDNYDKKLYLARDRFGEKPLYWGFQKDTLLFASDLAAITEHPKFENRINRDALELYLQYGYVPTPYSIYEGINKLTPGRYLEFDVNESLNVADPIEHIYWDATKEALSQEIINSEVPFSSILDTFDEVLGKAVGSQMQSDVAVGAFLSGGYDSTAIVSQMSKLSFQKVKTFTLGFRDSELDESFTAKQISSVLETDHTSLTVEPQDIERVIPFLPQIYSEPFADSSQIPTFLISELAAQHVTVALSGDAGDELFGGYNRYTKTEEVWKLNSKAPRFFREILGEKLQNISSNSWEQFFNRLNSVLPENKKIVQGSDKVQKIISVLSSESPEDYYGKLTRQIEDPKSFTQKSSLDINDINVENLGSIETDFLSFMMISDTLNYLPDDILVKVDRASMANSLEARVPFLDLDVFEFAWSLPSNLKINNGSSKWIVRNLVHEYVPKKIMDLPKRGFAIPLSDWLKGPLKSWASELLNEKRILSEGYFNPGAISNIWRDHLTGRRNNQHLLWSILMFQAWIESRKSPPQ